MDITTGWIWKKTTALRAAKRLDEVIHLRGSLVHHGPELFKGASVRRRQAENAMKLICKLVERVEITLGVAPKPWTPDKTLLSVEA